MLSVVLGAALLVACSSSGKFFFKNSSGTEIRLGVNDRTEVIAPGEVSRDYGRTQGLPIITIETDTCTFRYEPSDFCQPILSWTSGATMGKVQSI